MSHVSRMRQVNRETTQIRHNVRAATPLSVYGNIEAIEARNGFVIFHVKGQEDVSLDWRTALYHGLSMADSNPKGLEAQRSLTAQLEALNTAIRQAKHQMDSPTTAEERGAAKFFEADAQDKKLPWTPIHYAVVGDWQVRFPQMAKAELLACMRMNLRDRVPIPKIEDVLKGVDADRRGAMRNGQVIAPGLTNLDKIVHKNVAAGETKNIFPRGMQ